MSAEGAYELDGSAWSDETLMNADETITSAVGCLLETVGGESAVVQERMAGA